MSRQSRRANKRRKRKLLQRLRRAQKPRANAVRDMYRRLHKSRGWRMLESYHNIRVRWRWALTFALVVSVFCYLLGVEHMQGVGIALAIEHVVTRLGARAIDYVERAV